MGLRLRMGVWGAGIFDSDTGLDIRGDFRDMMGDGVPVDEAVAKLIEQYDPDDCEEEAAEFWFALASAQIQTGRLTELVKKRALELIASGDGLEVFARDCPEALPARKRAIKLLEKRILGPQKKPTKIKKAFVDTIEWEAGDGLAYQLPSGMWTGLKVRKLEIERNYQCALYVILDIYLDDVPTEEDFRSSNPKPTIYADNQFNRDIDEIHNELIGCEGKYSDEVLERRKSFVENVGVDRKQELLRSSVISLCRSGKRDKPGGKLELVVKNLPYDKIRRAFGTCFGSWKDLDAYLERDHGLK